jgi:hypothetical protein
MPPPGIFLSDKGKVMSNVPSKHFFLFIADNCQYSKLFCVSFRLFRFISLRFVSLIFAKMTFSRNTKFRENALYFLEITKLVSLPFRENFAKRNSVKNPTSQPYAIQLSDQGRMDHGAPNLTTCLKLCHVMLVMYSTLHVL